MSKIIDLTGRVIGKITVIHFCYSTGKRTFWWCRCSCGHEWMVGSDGLRIQKACKSCASTKHGLSKSREYKCWLCMIQRCTNQKAPYYKYYGGRGITVCESWLQSFESFYSDMGKSPTKEHSLGRIDNNGNYEPGNVEWQDRETQGLNKRSNHHITHNGVTLTVTQWGTKLGLNYITIINRLSRGKTIEQALLPVDKIYEKRKGKKRSIK